MIKKVCICDRCGSECEESFRLITPTKAKKTNMYYEGEKCEEMDLCPSCKYEFDNFLKINKSKRKKMSTYDLVSLVSSPEYMPFDNSTTMVDVTSEGLDRTNRIILNSGMHCKVFYPERGDE